MMVVGWCALMAGPAPRACSWYHQGHGADRHHRQTNSCCPSHGPHHPLYCSHTLGSSRVVYSYHGVYLMQVKPRNTSGQQPGQ